jgi:hypothetical protein
MDVFLKGILKFMADVTLLEDTFSCLVLCLDMDEVIIVFCILVFLKDT